MAGSDNNYRWTGEFRDSPAAEAGRIMDWLLDKTLSDPPEDDPLYGVVWLLAALVGEEDFADGVWSRDRVDVSCLILDKFAQVKSN